MSERPAQDEGLAARAHELATISYRSRYGSPASLVINGVDLSSVATGMTLETGPIGSIPRLTVDLIGDVAVDMTGVVRLVPNHAGAAAERGQVIAEFLDSVNPAALEESVLMGGSQSASPIQAALETLRVLASRQ